MAIHKTTEQQQLWQHRSGQVVILDAIGVADETDVSAEYRYSSQSSNMGTESEFLAVGWVKIAESEYLGIPELTHEQELIAKEFAETSLNRPPAPEMTAEQETIREKLKAEARAASLAIFGTEDDEEPSDEIKGAREDRAKAFYSNY